MVRLPHMFGTDDYVGVWVMPIPERTVVHVFTNESEESLTEKGWVKQDMADAPKKWITAEEIENIFGYHPPADAAIGAAHAQVRGVCTQLGHWFNANLPDCPEKTVLISTKLRELMMWTNAIIATKGLDPNFDPDEGIEIRAV